MKKYALISMDLEDFEDISSLQSFHLPSPPSMMDGLDRFLSVLDKYDIRATFFVLCSRLEKDGHIIEELIKKQHSIALHGLDHHSVGKDSITKFKEEVVKGKKTLEERFKIKIKGYRAPTFDLRDDELSLLDELGFDYDSSVALAGHSFPLYGTNPRLDGFKKINNSVYQKGNFYELAQSISEGPVKGYINGGGVFTRFFPMGIVKRSLKKVIRNNNFFLFYGHPFEFSLQKAPKIKHLRFQDYYYINMGRKHYLRRLEKIIDLLKKEGYEFLKAEEYLDLLRKEN